MRFLVIFIFIIQILVSFSLKYSKKKQIEENKIKLNLKDYKVKYNNIIWSDEFNSNKLSDQWIYDIGGSGWGNHELQYYKKDNIYLKDGNLVIIALKEHFGGYFLHLISFPSFHFISLHLILMIYNIIYSY